MRRVAIVVGFAVLTACAAEKAPKIVDQGRDTACAADTASIRAAQETYRATQPDGSYATMEQLVPGLLSEPSTLHRVTDVSTSSYKIRVANPRCGNAADAGDANVVDAAHPDNR